MPLNRVQYRDPVIAAIINYLKPKAHPDIRTWYYGDTLLISKSMLPAVSVAIDGMTLETDSTGDDVTEHRDISRDIAEGTNGNAEESVRFWHAWMAAERPFFAADRPWERADMIVSG